VALEDDRGYEITILRSLFLSQTLTTLGFLTDGGNVSTSGAPWFCLDSSSLGGLDLGLSPGLTDFRLRVLLLTLGVPLAGGLKAFEVQEGIDSIQ
jgi:hypothetical protein